MDQNLITTPFDATSTAAEVVGDSDLSGLRAVVTGASSGLGVETARVLVAAGAEVTLAVRDTRAGQQVASSLGGSAHRALVQHLDLADPGSVRAFVDGWSGPLHLLVANAGVVTSALERPVRVGSVSWRRTTSPTTPSPSACTPRWSPVPPNVTAPVSWC